MHDSYRKLLPLAGSREDLNYLIGQMLGEISNSHTYVGGGDDGDTDAEGAQPLCSGSTGRSMPASGRYRFATIYPGDNTRDDYRSPLAQPGLNVKAGDYLLAVNGVELNAPDRSGQPAAAGRRRHDRRADHRRQPGRRAPSRRGEAGRQGARVCARRRGSTHNRAVVDKLSGGRVGYVYMSDMEQLGTAAVRPAVLCAARTSRR